MLPIVSRQKSQIQSHRFHIMTIDHEFVVEPVTFGLYVDDSKVSWDFAPCPRSSRDAKAEPIGVLPLATQEYKLLEDLLFIMLGVDAIYIRAQPLQSPYAERSFTIDESADTSLKEMVKKILPVCSYHSTVVRFIEEKQERGQGMVNQAVAACMRELLEDYTILITQLEHKLVSQGALTLHKCLFYVQPCLAYMAVLATCAQAIWEGKCYGGSTLGTLHKRATSLTGRIHTTDGVLGENSWITLNSRFGAHLRPLAADRFESSR
ncbi:hypothetical protein HPB51_000630 [Rhipicephalus microplus]|uniref:Gamma-tubulin complex component n=1 Tax=Rhipicephalus microplus TaxID=6941 RepID=A0A9J6E5Y2_RHIMP|nr:hypothetical protein HPB51_000630 [Rhipicephalus microplus]